MDARSQYLWCASGEKPPQFQQLPEDDQRTQTGGQHRYVFKTDEYSSHSVILSRLQDGAGKRLLDVGAAQGDLASALTQRGYQVIALEGDPTLAAIAQDKCQQVIVADLDEPLPHLTGKFDVAVCADILEHLKNPARVLQEISQYLAPNAVVIISVPNIAHLWIRLQLMLGKFNYMDRGILDRSHLRFFTLSSFQEFLAEADLEILELTATPIPLPLLVPRGYHGGLLNVLHAASACLSDIWKTMFAYQFVAVTRRRLSA